MDNLSFIQEDESKLKDICANAYMQLDADGSGSIDLSEVKDMLLRQADEMLIEPPTQFELDELSNFLDPDGDGQMTFQEFYFLVIQMLQFMIKEIKDANATG